MYNYAAQLCLMLVMDRISGGGETLFTQIPQIKL